jgi:hypothetical protein
LNDFEFEREKWQADIRLREREIAIREREQDIKDRELQAKIDEQIRSRWTNPLVLAVLAAALAATGNAGVAVINGILQRSIERDRATSQIEFEARKAEENRLLEEAKGESARILEVIKTNEPDKAAVNLNFLLQTGLITNKDRRESLARFLETRKPGQGPVLPTARILPSPIEGGSTHVTGTRLITRLVILDTQQDNPDAELKALQQGKVAYHYLIDKEGNIRQLKRDNDIAFHTPHQYNENSIGIGVLHVSGSDYTGDQTKALTELVASLTARYGILKNNVMSNADLNPSRKSDFGKIRNEVLAPVAP